MGNYVLCCTPARSHVAPMLVIAGYLSGRGHRVRFLTGRRFAERVRTAGAEFVPLPAECDYDDTDLDGAFPGRERLTGLARMRFDIDHVFLNATPPQRRALDVLIEQDAPDAVLIDPGYAGAGPLMLGPPTGRPPILRAGITPLMFSSRDTAPFGLKASPSTNRWRRARNHALYRVSRRMFRANERYAGEILRAEGCSVPDLPLFDWPRLCDRFLQYSVPALEYPRSDLPSHVQFLGPLPTPRDPGFRPPEWWDDVVDSPRSVVYVTQGTVDNGDLTRLIGPTLQGLADLDVTVVATTGGGPAAGIAVPTNARVADFLPHSDLLGHVDVMVTNGGFGGVQHALSNGVPLVLAGDTEDKPEVAARVAWAGAGIDLRTARPRPRQVRRAVEAALKDGRYRAQARRLAEEMAATNALEATESALASVTPVEAQT